MIEIQEEQLKNINVKHIGEVWIQSIIDGSVGQIEQLCAPDVSSQLLTPKRFIKFDTVGDLIARVNQWFGECTNFQLQASLIEPVGERLGIFYRFLLLDEGTWYNIEQQLYCTLLNGRIAQLHLLCSGFQPVAANNKGMALSGLDEPVHDELLELYTGTSTTDSTCAVLTPTIRAKLREMQSGQILEVRVDDPAARSDIESWSRLSGNELLKVTENDAGLLRFFVKKK